METPPGFGFTGETNKVYRLKKAIYGLKQSPRELGLEDSQRQWCASAISKVKENTLCFQTFTRRKTNCTFCLC
jgi:hypothetical protein